MTDFKELKIEGLHALNTLFLAQDYLNSLSSMITENNPSDKWKGIAKEITGKAVDINNAKLFYSRILQELELQCEINYNFSQKKEETVYKLRNFDRIRRENLKLKEKVDQWILEKQ